MSTESDNCEVWALSPRVQGTSLVTGLTHVRGVTGQSSSCGYGGYQCVCVCMCVYVRVMCLSVWGCVCMRVVRGTSPVTGLTRVRGVAGQSSSCGYGGYECVCVCACVCVCTVRGTSLVTGLTRVRGVAGRPEAVPVGDASGQHQEEPEAAAADAGAEDLHVQPGEGRVGVGAEGWGTTREGWGAEGYNQVRGGVGYNQVRGGVGEEGWGATRYGCTALCTHTHTSQTTPHVSSRDPVSLHHARTHTYHSHVTLYLFSHQVALGMEHLSNHRLVHRDLAARNVLLTPMLDLKVACLSLSRDVYAAEYYPFHQVSTERVLMSTESIERVLSEY